MNLISQDYLMHHGVKGMKWGVRHDPEKAERKRIKKVQRRYARDWWKTYNKASHEFNSRIEAINTQEPKEK